MLTIDIRPISQPPEREQLTQLLQQLPQENALTETFMSSVAQHGGMLLGAFEGENLRGYAFGIIGLVDDAGRIDSVAAARLMLFLERMVVHPDHQNRGIGYELMVSVRLYASRLGLHFVTGSFDLLDSRHGWLYISKLGGIVGSYGGSDSAKPTGQTLPAKLDWWIGNNRVKRRTMQPRKPLKLSAFLQGGGTIVNTSTINDAQLPVFPETFEQSDNNIVLAEIPADFASLVQKDSTLADGWCHHIDALFRHYFENGFFVTDFVYQRGEPWEARAYYVFAHQDANLL